MMCLTDLECLEWMERYSVSGVNAEGWPTVVGDYELIFEIPGDTARQSQIAKELVDWMGRMRSALLWLRDCSALPNEKLKVVSALRQGWRERRALAEAPGHVFEAQERELLAGWVGLMINLRIGAHLFTWPSTGKVVQISCPNLIRLGVVGIDGFFSAQGILNRHDLPGYSRRGASEG